MKNANLCKLGHVTPLHKLLIFQKKHGNNLVFGILKDTTYICPNIVFTQKMQEVNTNILIYNMWGSGYK